MNLIVHTDGGSRGNPGQAAVGVVIQLRVTSYELRDVESFGKCIGVATNNEAEYQAVIEALKTIKNQNSKLKTVEFYLDSLLVVSQLTGLWKIKEARMREYLLTIRSLEQDLGIHPIYKHVPREHNKEADALVNQALDTLSL